MKDCIFCKIIAGEIKTKVYHEDENVIIIEDISKKAKLHYLAIVKPHFKNFAEMPAGFVSKIGCIYQVISEQAAKLGLVNGYRIVINQGSDANQSVNHLHMHILGGQDLGDII